MHYAGCILGRGTRIRAHFNKSICSFILTLNIQLSLSSGPLLTLTDLNMLLLLKYLLLHSHTKQTLRARLKYMIIWNQDTKWKRPLLGWVSEMNSQTVKTSIQQKWSYLQSIQSNPAGKPRTEPLKAATSEVKSSGMLSWRPRTEFLHKTLQKTNNLKQGAS